VAIYTNFLQIKLIIFLKPNVTMITFSAYINGCILAKTTPNQRKYYKNHNIAQEIKFRIVLGKSL
jgi:hypothetical protein